MEREYSQTRPQFAAHQIVCIEGKAAFLYSEVIEVIVTRKLCWARPLLLAQFRDYLVTAKTNFPTIDDIVDLREGSDLVLPLSLFRPALDTEIIPLITQLNSMDFSLEDKQRGSQELNNFVQQLWQENF